jgi:hypothetical protein
MGARLRSRGEFADRQAVKAEPQHVAGFTGILGEFLSSLSAWPCRTRIAVWQGGRAGGRPADPRGVLEQLAAESDRRLRARRPPDTPLTLPPPGQHAHIRRQAVPAVTLPDGRDRENWPGRPPRAAQEAVAPAWGRVPLVLLVAGLAAYSLTQLVEAVFRPARATGAIGRWRQRAVSSWGFLVYSVFCLSTARLLAGIPCEAVGAAARHGHDRRFAANGMGPAAGCPGRGSFRGGRPGGRPTGGLAQFPGAVHEPHRQ